MELICSVGRGSTIFDHFQGLFMIVKAYLGV